MDGQLSLEVLEERDVPATEVVRVRGLVAPVGSRPPRRFRDSDSGPEDAGWAPRRGPWVGATAVVLCLALALGDEGPWILVVPALAVVGGVWLDRRISFSFAEGFIGYVGDPEPVRGVPEDD